MSAMPSLKGADRSARPPLLLPRCYPVYYREGIPRRSPPGTVTQRPPKPLLDPLHQASPQAIPKSYPSPRSTLGLGYTLGSTWVVLGYDLPLSALSPLPTERNNIFHLPSSIFHLPSSIFPKIQKLINNGSKYDKYKIFFVPLPRH